MIQKAISMAFKITELLLPGLAGRLAVFLFFKPLKKSRPQDERSKLTEAKMKYIRLHNLPYHHNPSGTYALYRWGKGPSVLLVHGWGGRASQLAAFVDPLLQGGYQVISFDAFGHGNSSGKRTNIMEFITIIKDIEKKTGGFAAIIGHSLGGMAALLAVKRGVTAKKVVTINTPVSIDFIFDSFAAQLGASSKSIAYISRFLENMTQMPIDEFTADKLVSNMQVPGMIIHDRDDKEIPVDQAYSLHQGWDKSTLTLTRQLGHRRILHDQDTISNIIRNLSILEKQEALRVPLAE